MMRNLRFKLERRPSHGLLSHLFTTPELAFKQADRLARAQGVTWWVWEVVADDEEREYRFSRVCHVADPLRLGAPS